MAEMGYCWLCGKWRPLTEEHIPPRKAFNSAPVLEQFISDRSKQIGRISWELRRYEKGVVERSLCGPCNSYSGGQYGQHYVHFIRDIAERVDRAPIGATVQVQVEYPLRLLKAVLQPFISANGKAFVDHNLWIRKFLHHSRNQEWDPLTHLYVYATPVRAGRQTGPSGMLNIFTGSIKVLSEFTFWPLGSVLTHMPLDGLPLAPIHQWAKRFRYEDRGPESLSLPVHVISTPFPLDFRSREQVRKDAEEDARANGQRELTT
jgi:hypothetical protein